MRAARREERVRAAHWRGGQAKRVSEIYRSLYVPLAPFLAVTVDKGSGMGVAWCITLHGVHHLGYSET